MAQQTLRVASKAAQIASTPASTLRSSFPPKHALFNPAQPHAHLNFSPETWAALQPPPASALAAFAHRIGLARIVPNTDDILLACTHSSYPPFHAAHSPPGTQAVRSNANLSTVGNSLLGLFAAEYLHASYPHLPTRALKAAVSAYVGPMTCAAVAKEMGATPLLRWNRPDVTGPESISKPITLTEALATTPRALTALVYQSQPHSPSQTPSNRSLPLARKFAHAYFLSRDLDLRPLLKFRDPKMQLARTVSKFQRTRPVSRLLKETGRLSNSPMFVVGIYSGADKLGDGFGTSLKMAEYRAAEDALHRLYLTRTPQDSLTLPTDTFVAGEDVFDADGEGAPGYVPGDIGELEVIYASKDR